MYGRLGLSAGSCGHPSRRISASTQDHPHLASGTAHPAPLPPAAAGLAAIHTFQHPPPLLSAQRTSACNGHPNWVCQAGRQSRGRPPLRLQTATAEVEPGAEAVVAVAAEAAEAPEEADSSPLPGVVRVQCVQDVPRFDLPLLLGSFRSSTCNAVAVTYCGQPYLLTPAASVVYGSQIRVLLPGRDKPFPARLAHLGPECELAVLAVEAEEFWREIVPYELAPYGLPHLQQPVAVVSYAAGQPRPRSSPGTVMRTEVVTYPTALQRLLGLTVAVAVAKEQLGSAIVDSRGHCLGLVFGRTAGNTGGRKAAGGGGMGGSGGGGASGGDERWGQGRRRVGRRRGRRGQTEASVMVVPVPVVTHFLEDIRSHGRYLGFPTLGIFWKRTEAAGLRRYTGMLPNDTGVAIMSINPTSSLAAHARPLDVLAAVGDAAVGNDGTVAFRGGAESINISYHVSQFQVGDTVELGLIRSGQRLQVSLTLGVLQRLVPLHLGGSPPQYLVVGGVVLTVLSAPFMEGAFGRSWAVRAPVQLLREWHNQPSHEDQQIVVVAECQDLGPGSATDGYERRAVMHQTVVRCNRTPVLNLRHLVALVAEAMAAAEAAAEAEAAGPSRSSPPLGSGRPRGSRAVARSTSTGAGTSSGGAAADLAAATAQQQQQPPRAVSDGAADAATSAGRGPASAGAGPLGESNGDGGTSTEGSTSSCASGGALAAPANGTTGAAAGPLPASSDATAAAAAPATAVATAGESPAPAPSGRRYGPGPPLDPQNLVLELSSGMIVVLPLRRARQDTAQMLAEYEVQHAVSEDLRSVYDSALQLEQGRGAGPGPGGRAGGSRGRGKGRPAAAVGEAAAAVAGL